MVDWRFPLVRQNRKFTEIIEPVAAVIASPEGANPTKIPNEDSQDLKLDDTNLFSPSRFTGVDRVESGQRVIYGLKWGLYGAGGGATTAFLGHSYRLREESEFAGGPGLEDNLSDIVGRLRVAPSSLLDFLYRFRFDADDLRANRNEVSLAAGPPTLRLTLDYLFVNQEQDTGTEEFGNREELSGRLEVGLGRYWRASANVRQDLKGVGLLSAGVGFTYEDECFIFNVALERSRTRDRDLEPTNTVFFKIDLKTLGNVGSAGG
jgi:LPS-assembly protein